MKKWKDLTKKEKMRICIIGGVVVGVVIGGVIVYFNRDRIGDCLEELVDGVKAVGKNGATCKVEAAEELPKWINAAGDKLTGETLTATGIGELAGIKPHEINLRLEELGLANRFSDGYHPTRLAEDLGLARDIIKETRYGYIFRNTEWDKSLIPFILSQEEINAHNALIEARKELVEDILARLATEDLIKSAS